MATPLDASAAPQPGSRLAAYYTDRKTATRALPAGVAIGVTVAAILPDEEAREVAVVGVLTRIHVFAADGKEPIAVMEVKGSGERPVPADCLRPVIGI